MKYNQGDIVFLNGDTLCGFVARIVSVDFHAETVDLVPVDEPDCTPFAYSLDAISPAPRVGEFVQPQTGMYEGLDCIVVQIDVPLGNADVVLKDDDADAPPLTYPWEALVVYEERAVIEDDQSHMYPEVKESNPKDIIGSTKPGLDALSWPVLFEMGAGMDDGGYKYGRQNYRVVGVRHSVYFNAAMRHLADWWEGEDIDPDSGLSHITKVMTCLMVLRDSMIMGNDVDDRPVRPPADWMERAREHTKQVIARHPNPVPPYLNK